jgi:flagellar FliJ protein
MPRFRFRLQRVLDYRRLVEGWARDAYMEARARRLQADLAIAQIEQRRARALTRALAGLAGRQTLEAYIERLDGERRAQEAVRSILMQEEGQAFATWRQKRREAEALDKLREKHEAEWKLEQARKEQAALDEWAVTRRAA